MPSAIANWPPCSYAMALVTAPLRTRYGWGTFHSSVTTPGPLRTTGSLRVQQARWRHSPRLTVVHRHWAPAVPTSPKALVGGRRAAAAVNRAPRLAVAYASPKHWLACDTRTNAFNEGAWTTRRLCWTSCGDTTGHAAADKVARRAESHMLDSESVRRFAVSRREGGPSRFLRCCCTLVLSPQKARFGSNSVTSTLSAHTTTGRE